MPWKNSITPTDVVAFLNELLEIDPAAIRALFEIRVTCGEDLAKHPTAQVRGPSEGSECYYDIGVLGVLNGLFGVDEDGRGPIQAVEGLVTGVHRFILTPPIASQSKALAIRLDGCRLTLDVKNNRHARAAAYSYVEALAKDDPAAAQALRAALDGLPPIPLAPWQQELADEYGALNERRQKLRELLGSKAYEAMLPEERNDLNNQGTAMDSYSRALAARIARFNT